MYKKLFLFLTIVSLLFLSKVTKKLKGKFLKRAKQTKRFQGLIAPVTSTAGEHQMRLLHRHSLIIMSTDDFLPSKMAIFVV